ncbi:MAG: hypothetical protein V1898_04765 [Patescibacteria group bacterium]
MPEPIKPFVVTNEGTTARESKTRKLAYVDKFRDELRERPGIIRSAVDLMNQAVSEYEPESFEYRPGNTVRYDKDRNIWLINDPGIEYLRDEHGQPVRDEEGRSVMRRFDEQPFYLGRGTLLVPGEAIADPETDLQVTVLGRSNRDIPSGFQQIERRVDKTDYFRVDLNKKPYFVKRSTVTQNPGFDEFRAVQKAKEVLADLGFVEVIDAQLGYQDDQHSWYIASWKELESAGFIPYHPSRLSNDYGRYVDRPRESQLPKKQYREIEKRLRSSNLDVDLASNLFFIPGTDKFFLLDVTSGNIEGIGQPYRIDY